MPRVMDLAQGTPDWLEWRVRGLGSSDAPGILGLSPWTTIYKLWLDKARPAEAQGLTAPNAAMLRGIELEPHARQEVEWLLGQTFQPVCLVHDEYPFLKASLDGWSEDQTAILEIKCPGKKAHTLALQGQVPDYYMPQLNHQLLVSGSALAWYASYDPGWKEPLGEKALARLAAKNVQVHYEGQLVLIPVYPDQDALAALLEAEVEFWRRVQEGDPPPLVMNDLVVDSSQEWAEAATEYRELHQQIAALEQELKVAGGRLKEMAGDQPTTGAGVRVVTFRRAGGIDYEKATTELIDIMGEVDFDIEQFRRADKAVSRITLEAA